MLSPRMMLQRLMSWYGLAQAPRRRPMIVSPPRYGGPRPR
jgi:hypothetical protein